MTTGMAIRHYDHRHAAELRPLLLEVYGEVYAEAAKTDPFATVDRFAQGLDAWSAKPGWTCVVGYDGDQPVGYAYGAPLVVGAPWWGGLLADVDPDLIEETGSRTYALSELMVRVPWRKTGVSKQLHDALLEGRPEERATLLVDQSHPKVHALYESWGWQKLGDLRPRLPNAPVFHAMLLPLR
ncbi:GNAT family N-acetyltransferase [Streptomyces rimosus]|uniref:GNAT family N-acetyltransferase n=1 Tax=Streptomyces rimosus TaxID=1927 RepID=UPI000AA6827C|nr:GNAT family N-acetyltransferase [Streptomyces rimosus]